MARKIGGAVRQRQNFSKLPKIKYVKKAGMWVKTYVEQSNNGGETFKQQWSVNREDLL